YEYGLYEQTALTNVNGVNSWSENGAIRSVPLSGLQYDSAGNVTQQSVQSALDQVVGSSGLYSSNTDTGMVIASVFPITQPQFDTITQTFMNSQIANITEGTEKYGVGILGINYNDCENFVMNAATAAGLTIAPNQNGSGPALPLLDFG